MPFQFVLFHFLLKVSIAEQVKVADESVSENKPIEMIAFVRGTSKIRKTLYSSHYLMQRKKKKERKKICLISLL